MNLRTKLLMKRKQSDLKVALELHQKELCLRVTQSRNGNFGFYNEDKAFNNFFKQANEYPENVLDSSTTFM
jgi:hypothetical protein